MAFVSQARFEQQGDTPRAFSGAPDLAVEILSPSNTPAGVHAKVADYFAAGARRVWVIDCQARSVIDYASLLAPRRIDSDGFLKGGDVVPGFRVRVGEIFEV